MAPGLLKSGRVLGTALVLAFVGAIEQNLLGFFLAGRSFLISTWTSSVESFRPKLSGPLVKHYTDRLPRQYHCFTPDRNYFLLCGQSQQQQHHYVSR
jgi:hypothetical protein